MILYSKQILRRLLYTQITSITLENKLFETNILKNYYKRFVLCNILMKHILLNKEI